MLGSVPDSRRKEVQHAKPETNPLGGVGRAGPDSWKRRGDRRHTQLDACEANNEHDNAEEFGTDHYDTLNHDSIYNHTEVVSPEEPVLDSYLSALVLDLREHELLVASNPVAASRALPPLGAATALASTSSRCPGSLGI